MSKIICLICGPKTLNGEPVGNKEKTAETKIDLLFELNRRVTVEENYKRRNRIELNIPAGSGARAGRGRTGCSRCVVAVGKFTRFMWPINVLSSYPNCRQLRACVPISAGPFTPSTSIVLKFGGPEIW